MQPDPPRPGRRRSAHRRGASAPEPFEPFLAPEPAVPPDGEPYEAEYEPPRPDSFAVEGALGMGGDLDRAFLVARRSRIRNLVLGVGSLTLVTATGIGAAVAWAVMSSGPPGDIPVEGTVSAAPKASPAASGSVPGYADTAPASAPVAHARRGTGKFLRAPVAVPGTTFGRGKLIRYRVEVEGGLGLSPALFAREVDRVLGDPRGWTASGKYAFRRVSSGHVDFAVRLASPATAEKLCGAYGLTVDSSVNCSAGRLVVVNLGRWLAPAAPYRGAPADYRAFLLNHGLGHHLGAGHRTCAGKGRAAPVMQDQVLGLDGCRANPWPYDARGRFVNGPEVS
ncbi:DUF3152 domain-containing protein [Actinomadura atramentaria]|uniref:DUF3152 domain-containing protein n=1 Tax=Actinomadura atramentaria TaxID=1990 RepID=UPI0003A79701|nr:DUF3152 domain-containing protein [Actinomadura atramentaria]